MPYMTAISIFDEMDRRLKITLEDFSVLAGQIQMEHVCELSDEKTIAAQTYPGVYKIDIKNNGTYPLLQDWMRWFQEKWDDPIVVKKFVPTTKLGQIKKHLELQEWMPIYIGKSKKIASRVLEHIRLPLDKPTFAMKLRARGDFFAQNTFRLSVAHVNVHHYDLLMPMVELALRKRFNPIVGKQ
jgi:hypothetical protein